ncbi:MAG: hypothetical protein ABSB18_06065 [Candidatus Omnitrophota bacterium]
MICKLTLKEGVGVKAHVIPECFYRIDSKNKQPLKILSSNEGIYPQRSQTGIYDPNIVIQEGENILQSLDNYASDLLIKNFLAAQTAFDGEILQIDNYDYNKLKLFFLSVLWRASVSQQQFFKVVDLGEHEENIRKALLENNAGDSDFYSVILSVFSGVQNGVGTLNPQKTKIDSINYYKLYLGNFLAWIKVDRRRSEEPLRSFSMENGRPLYILKKNLHSSKEFPLMKSIAQRFQNSKK